MEIMHGSCQLIPQLCFIIVCISHKEKLVLRSLFSIFSPCLVCDCYLTPHEQFVRYIKVRTCRLKKNMHDKCVVLERHTE